MSKVNISCPYCGKEITVDDEDQTEYCPKCGSLIDVKRILALKKGAVNNPITPPIAQAPVSQPKVTTEATQSAPVQPTYAPEASVNNYQAPQVNQKRQGKAGLFILKHGFAIVYTGLFVFILVMAILGIVAQGPKTVYAITLIVFANALLIIGAILSQFIDRKICYTCPVCGARRTKHRHFLRTDSRFANDPQGGHLDLTNVYQDSYVCPEDGTTEERIVHVRGGTNLHPKDLEEY